MITRDQWGARQPSRAATRIDGAVDLFFVHHTVSGDGSSQARAMASLREVQRVHMDGPEQMRDIGYSWAVDQLGNIYELRGWWVAGGHTAGYNDASYAAVFIGNTEPGIDTPSTAALRAIADVYLDGQARGALSPAAEILGHRDRLATACPGQQLYDLLPRIRSLVAEVPELGPSTEEPPDMTPEQDAMLREIRDNVRTERMGYFIRNPSDPPAKWTNVHITELGRAGQLDLTSVPTAVLLAELSQRTRPDAR